jgi:predicted P-loop ATPase
VFRITDFVEFDKNGRALCPSCQSEPRRYSKKNLSLVPGGNGAYKCHKGCTPEQIRASLGQPKRLEQKTIFSHKRKAKLYSENQILELVNALLNFSEGKNWLSKRGITANQIIAHKLGLLTTSSGQKAIAIPYPVNGKYLLKYALVDWTTGKYEFRQPGISKRLWIAKEGTGDTFLCEGEWDAIALAELLKNTDYRVVTGSNGAGVVPEGLPPSGEIFVFYDYDEAGRKGAEAVVKAVGSRAKICQVPYLPINDELEIPKGYDVRDAIQRGATASDFIKAINQSKQEEKLSTRLESPAPVHTSPKINLKQLQLQNLRELYANRLRKNLRGYQIELDGKPVNPDYLYLQCLEQDGIVISKDRAIDIFNFLASEYDPVLDYLNQCYDKYGNSTVNLLLEGASTRYFYTNKQIYNIYLRKTLIGAVKRTFQPGCKFDTALVLFGNQGYGKSTFWRTLAGEWFDDTVSGFDQNEIHKLHYFWIEELGEIDRIQNKSDVSVVKAFLSRQVDAFRPVFTRSVSKFPRRFIIVGSTNRQEILLDSTGDRRFWIIPITKPINNNLVWAERDQLWAAAVALYRAGEDCYLTTELEILREQENENYRVEDPWYEVIANYINSRQTLRASEILTDVLQIPIERQDKRAQMRVTDILRSLGWQKRHTRQGKIWEKPNS